MTAQTTRTKSATPAAKFTASEGSLGKNIAYTLDANGILTLRIDLNVSQGASSSGKSDIVATTSGNKEILGGNGAVAGCNIYRRL